MKLLILGANGRLAKEFMKIAKFSSYEIFAYTKQEVDITSPKSLRLAFSTSDPDIVINFAAYTNVDGAESAAGSVSSSLVNILGPGLIASYCKEYGAKLCHISTSFVFDGDLDLRYSYTEDSLVNPINIYGETKLFGEQVIKGQIDNYFIIRTNWLFGSSNDFLARMISIAKENGKISAITSQYGSFTLIKDLAAFCLDIIDTNKFGVYNYVNRDFTTPLEFISFALKELNINASVEPIQDKDFKFIAKRQKNLCLNTDKAIKIQGNINNWKISLQNFLKESYND